MHSYMITYIYAHIYREVHPIYLIVGRECVRGITHFALALPFCTYITHLHLHYPLFALVLPICTYITHYLHLYYLFALVLPVCTCITHLYLHYKLFALALLIICTCITHYLHLYYPFALELPICTCITHYPSIVGVNNAHNCIINCKALQCIILGMVLSSNNTWSQHRSSRARNAQDW